MSKNDSLLTSILSGRKDEDITKSELLAFMEVLHEYRKEDNNMIITMMNRWTTLTRRVTLLESGKQDMSISYSHDFYGNGLPQMDGDGPTELKAKVDASNLNFHDPRAADNFFKAYYLLYQICKDISPEELFDFLFYES